MPDFFAAEVQDGVALLSPEDSHHALRVLRLRPGDAVRVSFDGHRYEAALEINGKEAIARLSNEVPVNEARTRITLYQGWPKGDKLDRIVRQATELGVHAIVPCLLTRCVARPEPGKKMDRFQKIAKEAAMQAGRSLIPQVLDPLGFEALCQRLAQHEQALVAYEQEHQVSLKSAWQGASDIALVIGPEGGITEEEVSRLPGSAVSLGKRILRTETAGIAGIAVLLALSEDH